jgi:hypothetical protein
MEGMEARDELLIVLFFFLLVVEYFLKFEAESLSKEKA